MPYIYTLLTCLSFLDAGFHSWIKSHSVPIYTFMPNLSIAPALSLSLFSVVMTGWGIIDGEEERGERIFVP